MQLKNLCALGLAFASLTLQPAAKADGIGLSVGVVIRTAPPAPHQEVIVAQPSPRHVWIGGYWRWQGNRHIWIAGHWELPPREHAVYVPARWDRRDDGYVFVEGSWQDAGAVSNAAPIPAAPPASEIIVSQPPPAPPAEAIGERPFPNAAWTPGYWSWGNGAYAWTPGRWVEPPSPTSAYVTPHWEARDNGYAFSPGYWRENSVQPQPSAPAQIVVTEPPPPPQQEIIIGQPSRNHIWIKGHWYWHDGRYVWAPGHWERAPHRGAVYIEPHWENHGHGYVLIEGYWR
jgi:hypothetical protein